MASANKISFIRDYVPMLISRSGTVTVPGGPENQIVDGKTRARLRAVLYRVLPQEREVAALYSTQVEACAVTLSKSNYATYVATMGRVIYNIESNGEHIIKNYPISRVCKLSHKRLDAETAHAQRDEAVELRLKNLIEFAKQEAAYASQMASSIQTDNAIRCPKCHTQDGITRVTAQMNAGDEGMTTRCLCVCGHRWQIKS